MSIHTSIDAALLFTVYRYGKGTESPKIHLMARVTDVRIIDLQIDTGLVLSPQLECAALYECHELLEGSKGIVVWYVFVLDPTLVQTISIAAACQPCRCRPVFETRFELSAVLPDDSIGFGVPLRVGIASHVAELSRTL